MIAVLDSGSGGANIILECMKLYNQDFVFLVDNKNCPYGNKPKSELEKIVIENINYLLTNYDLDFIIVGCNTASSVINFEFLEKNNCPILKTYPNLKSAVKFPGVKILFATKNTIETSNYVKYYLLNYPNIKTLCIKDLPKVIDEKISNNTKNSKKIEKMLKNGLFFRKKLKKQYKNADSMILGCTHFKHITQEISEVVNKKIMFYYCETDVAKISKFLIKKNKKVSTVKVILTQKDDNLQSSLERIFDNV